MSYVRTVTPGGSCSSFALGTGFVAGRAPITLISLAKTARSFQAFSGSSHGF
jgi:hypothetical protein